MSGMSEDKHTQDPLFITLGYITPLISHVREQGVSTAPILDVLGLDESDLHSSDIRLPDRVIDEIFAVAEKLCDDPNIGFHAGRLMGLANIGILGPLILTCTKASQVMGLHARYQTLVGNGAHSDYEVGLETVCLHFRVADGGCPFTRHSLEFNLTGWISLVDQVTSAELRPELIVFPTAAPEDASEQEAFFNCEMRYNEGDHLAVHFPRYHLERALLAGDSSLREPLETAARQRLAELQGQAADRADSVLNRILRFIREQLIHGPPSIEQAADHLDVSVRTLQRQLEADGMTYKALVDDARKELGGRYISNEELSLVDVALMLGFSEQSSFQRAFKRWYSLTPGEYRRQAVA